MITKETVLGVISILENGIIQIREDTLIKEDGIEISRTYFRYVLEPGEDVSGRTQLIRDISEVVWTPEVISARKRELDEIRSRIAPTGAAPDSGGAIREPGTSENGLRSSHDSDR